MGEWSERDFKITMCWCVNDFNGKVDKQEHMYLINREMETLEGIKMNWLINKKCSDREKECLVTSSVN